MNRKAIKLLDCTLRDGGYINNWNWGKKHISNTIMILEESGVEYIEVGFLRDEIFNSDRTVFHSIDSITDFIPNKRKNIIYTVMAEAIRPIPVEKISLRGEKTVDAIRVIVWKDKHDADGKIVDALQDGFNYCRRFVDLGYDLFIQPARVEQYSDEEFISMLNMFSSLNPKAVYIVDSWGTMYSDEVLHYAKLADRYLKKDVVIGFHGHNNLMQAFANAVDFVNCNIDRELMLDSSVYGIGRGAGNLNTEIIAKYLNEKAGKNYNVRSFFEIYEKTVKDLAKRYTWGYLPAYYMSAFHHANPQYGTWYGIEHNIDSLVIDRILDELSDEDKVLFTSAKAEMYSNQNNVH